MRQLWWSVGVVLMVAIPASAQVTDCATTTCYYIRDGGTASTTGTGACVSTGSGSWLTAGACDDLPATLVRGATYLIADGAYAVKEINIAASGTIVTTFKKAIASDHGTATGWDASYGDGQAVFGDMTSFYTSAGRMRVIGHYYDFIGHQRGLVFNAWIGLMDGWNQGTPANVTHINFSGLVIRQTSIVAKDITFTDVEFGEFNTCAMQDLGDGWDQKFREDGIRFTTSAGDPRLVSERVTFDGVVVHDTNDDGDSCAGHAIAGTHVDCMQTWGSKDITVRNSLFYNCATSNIMAQSFYPQTGWNCKMENWVVENNFFGGINLSVGGAPLNWSGGTGNIFGTNVIRNNTIAPRSTDTAVWITLVPDAATGSTLTITNNILRANASGCKTGTWDHNLNLTGVTCGTNTLTGTPGLVSTPAQGFLNGLIPDYHLTAADTAAKDRGSLTNYPATDYDGDARYVGSAPDLGADEYTTGVPTTPTGLRVGGGT